MTVSVVGRKVNSGRPIDIGVIRDNAVVALEFEGLPELSDGQVVTLYWEVNDGQYSDGVVLSKNDAGRYEFTVTSDMTNHEYDRAVAYINVASSSQSWNSREFTLILHTLHDIVSDVPAPESTQIEQLTAAAAACQEAAGSASDAATSATSAAGAANSAANAANSAAESLRSHSCLNIISLIAFARGQSFTTNGITFLWNSSYTECTVSGLASGNANYNIFVSGNSLPFAVTPGKTYAVVLSDWPSDIKLIIRDYSGGVSGNDLFFDNKSGSVTIPSGTSGLMIQIRASSGADYRDPTITIQAPQIIPPNSVEQVAGIVERNSVRERPVTFTDLNDAVKIGYYLIGASVSLSHSPTENDSAVTGYRVLEIFSDTLVGSSNICQRLNVCSGTYNGNIYIRRRTGSAANPNWGEWKKILSIKDANDAHEKFQKAIDPIASNTVLNNYSLVERSSQGNNVGTKIRVMSYNICHFNNDTTTYISDEKIGNLNKMMMSADPDFLCLQEDDRYIDSGDTKESVSYLYYPKYPVRLHQGNGVNIRSKQAYTSGDILIYNTTTPRSLAYCVYTVGSDTLLLISTHPSPGSADDRAEQYDELFKWIGGVIDLKKSSNNSTTVHVPTFTHCVIGMDSNAIATTDQSSLKTYATNAGFHLANGGVLGWINTCLRTPPYTPIDNILVSDNIIINRIEVLSGWYDLLYSDHVPIYCDLTLLDT